ncbi:protoporphyrinogen oxidase [Gordonia sp. (in: high G+C Gram-positive bacteria)]|uniref:protoporphyrinogen oxidase n=1 Tax=Gordonia sp. (in: high G+C Gram-positive bacteria) TaxID=84139 RepID=UPI003C73EE2D
MIRQGRTQPRIAIIGGGVSGLTSAFRLRQRFGDDMHLELFDAADRPGGLLCTKPVGGVAMDVGAEAFIVRRPEALNLVTELGLADHIVAPGPMRPAIWTGGAQDGRLHPLPTPALMGIPVGPEPMTGLAAEADLERMATEPLRPFEWTVGDDPAVGHLVGERFGRSVVERGVNPMLGGVYSAVADQLGLREAIPALAKALDEGAPSLTAAVEAVLAAGRGSAGPVFGALRGGYRELVTALTEAVGNPIQQGISIAGIHATPTGYVLSGAPTDIEYDGVVVAVPIWTAARLLREISPQVAGAFGEVEAAGSAVVAVAVPAETALPEHSGVLVATDSPLRIKAITFSSQKWPHLRSGPVRTLRMSFGRLGAPVTDTDDQLVAAAIADLATVCAAASVPAPTIIDAVVQRWPEGLPHYGPGHLKMISSTMPQLPSGIAVAGSGYAGVGVPACIGTATSAVGKLTADLQT